MALRPETSTRAALSGALVMLPTAVFAQETYGALGMNGTGFFMALIIGAIAGWLAEQFTRSNMGLLMNIVMGIIGAFVGSLIFGLLGIRIGGFIGNLISATIGAILVITIYRAIAGRRTTTY